MRNEFAKCEIKASVFSGRKPQAGNCCFVNNVERRTAATTRNPCILSSRFCRSLRRWLPDVEAYTQYKVLIDDAFTGRPCSRETA